MSIAQSLGYPLATMRQHYLELILFSTRAELRAERARSYLGLLWWVLQPAMLMAVFYIVFGVILKTGGPGYVPFLLVGLALWQWLSSCMTHAGYAIWNNLGLIRQVRLPSLCFPVVQVLADSVKFLYILALLLVVLWVSGYPPNVTYIALIPVLASALLFAFGAGFLFASVIPLLPDLRFVIEQFLQALMFLSGVVFSLAAVPPSLRGWFDFNPVAVLAQSTRDVLLHGQWPDWQALAQSSVVSLLLTLASAWAVQRLTPRYVKLPVA